MVNRTISYKEMDALLAELKAINTWDYRCGEKDHHRVDKNGFHALRRGIATNLYSLGASDKTVQRCCGTLRRRSRSNGISSPFRPM
jgi:hypothetical protein